MLPEAHQGYVATVLVDDEVQVVLLLASVYPVSTARLLKRLYLTARYCSAAADCSAAYLLQMFWS